MRRQTCERIGCDNQLEHQRRGKPRRFCSKRCGRLDRLRRSHDATRGRDEILLTADHRGYLEAFENWLRHPSHENLMLRRHALADLMSRHGIEA